MQLETHADLVRLSARWLETSQRCRLVVTEFCCVMINEQPDAIGWNPRGQSVLVECKSNRADFLRDKFKSHRYGKGLGQRRYFLCPVGVITPEDLESMPQWFSDWGLILVRKGRARLEVAAKARAEHNIAGEACLLVNIARKASDYEIEPFKKDGIENARPADTREETTRPVTALE